MISDSVRARSRSHEGLARLEMHHECVKVSENIHYTALDQKNTYTLSDRERPARYAGQKVRVTGVLMARTNVIQVESIEPVR